MSPTFKRFLHWIGSALAVAGVVFVVLQLKEYSSALDFSRFDRFTWKIVAILAIVYGLANMMLAQAWRNVLEHFGVHVRRLWASRVYGLTSLAKYVPGNIMHLASRQAMGLASGVSGWALVKASIWEIGLMSITGAFFLILITPHFLPLVTEYMAMAGFISALFLMGLGIVRLLSLAMLWAFSYYIVFLFISGLIFTGVLSLVIGTSIFTPSMVLNFCSVFVVAWLAGLLTPGSPAGIGIREIVLVFLLNSFVLESELLLAILLSRIVTVSGDVIYFLIASLFPNNGNGILSEDTSTVSLK